MITRLDFETYYDSEYSLKKMSTESYIRDPRFEVIGVSIGINNQPARWYTGNQITPALASIDWSQSSLLAFNTAFDGAILAWHYGHYPALYLDAMGMARCCGAAFNSASLKAVCEVLEVGSKGDYVTKVSGKRAKDFTPQELYEYGEYCINDNEKATEIYKKLLPKFPMSEVLVQDRMLRMFIEPVLQFDRQGLEQYYQEVIQKKQKAIEEVAQLIGVQTEEEVKKLLMSNPKFAALLESLGVDPPKKLSPTTGKETYAFAKTDPEFLELLEDDNTTVQVVVGARLGSKSTIEESRSEGFIDISKRGPWPVQYTYCGAHLRFSGGGNVNPQNLKRGGQLRNCVLPPPGHLLVAADLKQIQARFVNYIAEQNDVLQIFKDFDAGIGEDIYCIAAGRIYNKTITKNDTKERTVGKISELSNGFGASGKAYKRMVFAQAGINIELKEAERVVRIYRDNHKRVQNLWYRGDDVLEAIIQRKTFTFGRFGVIDGSHPEEGVGLPGGLFIRLPGLTKTMNEKGERRFVYMHKKKATEIYGAMLVALCMQGFERIVMSHAMIRLSRRLLPARMMTHDDLVFAVPIADVEQAKVVIHEEMTRQLPWAPDFPLACDVGSGSTYGECK